MERLMQIADEMQEKFERYDLLFRVSGRACQLVRKLLDLVDDAVFFGAKRGRGARRHGRMAETCLIEVRVGDLDVDEVPPACLLAGAIPVRVTILVRPGRRSGDIVCSEGVRIGCE